MKIKIPGHEIEIDEADKEYLSKISKSNLLGLLGGDWIKYWRWVNLQKILQKVKKKSDELSLDLVQVPEKFLQEFFEQSSLEKDETLQEMWTNLLLNKCTGKMVNIFYLNILKEMEPNEAIILNLLFKQSNKNDEVEFDGEKVISVSSNVAEVEFDTIIEKFYSFRLLKPGKLQSIRMGGGSPSLDTTKTFSFTKLGLDFCQKSSGVTK